MGPSCKGTSQGLGVALTRSDPPLGMAAVPAPLASASPLAGVCTVLQGMGAPKWAWGAGWEAGPARLLCRQAQGHIGNVCFSFLWPWAPWVPHVALRSSPSRPGEGWPSEHEDSPQLRAPWPSVPFCAQLGSLMAHKAMDKANEPSDFWGEGLVPKQLTRPRRRAMGSVGGRGSPWQPRGRVRQQGSSFWGLRSWPPAAARGPDLS